VRSVPYRGSVSLGQGAPLSPRMLRMRRSEEPRLGPSVRPLGDAGRACGAMWALGAYSRLVASAQDLANVNKIRHVLGHSKRLLGRLVTKHGSQDTVYRVQ
jgi:hypothetical protein